MRKTTLKIVAVDIAMLILAAQMTSIARDNMVQEARTKNYMIQEVENEPCSENGWKTTGLY